MKKHHTKFNLNKSLKLLSKTHHQFHFTEHFTQAYQGGEGKGKYQYWDRYQTLHSGLSRGGRESTIGTGTGTRKEEDDAPSQGSHAQVKHQTLLSLYCKTLIT